jgi:hypothetical protein
LLVAIAGCGRKASRHDAAPITRDPATECASVFDRFYGSVANYTAQIGLHESAEAARERDREGLAACVQLPEATRACLLAAPVGPAAWSTCQVAPLFTLFDATSARERLLGAPVPPADSVARLAELVGTWSLPARGLDDAITWTIGPMGTLAVHRESKRGNTDEPIRKLTFHRDHQLALVLGKGTQYVPFHRAGNTLYVSWTTGALAVPIARESEIVLDLADQGRWLVLNGTTCTIVDPRRGASPATCTWEGDAAAGTRTLAIGGDGLAQRWSLREGALVHPAMETFTKR